ncbi:protein of unknown function DUF1385 [Thermodesulfobium narugense DSM 14796]|uniref:DUF1385 domain-containing protein n=1 Tax=Thermodesulfobium narugense DSM 14796 TaxID=747365 RepID=M1E4G2_9BACT|nr:DUF1385 domain-containing protein [Thermodesulfobium narugense]AEE14127.1 protein of unknown function DUF1385 [Thermodesulfobium narugense DSM 14796]
MRTLLISDLRPVYKKINFVSQFDTVGRLILFFRTHGCEIFLTYTNDGYWAISNEDVIGFGWDDLVSELLLRKSISPLMFVSESDSIDKFFQLSLKYKRPVVVLGHGNIPVGILYYQDVMAFLNGYPMPTRVSGISTPFGIFFSNSLARGGISDIKLFLTGSLFSFFAIIMFLAGDFFYEILKYIFVDFDPYTVSLLSIVLPLIIFLFLIKFTGLSKLHGAEHKVAHAIESGDILSSHSVGFYSRVHKRCGTNLLILLLLLQVMVIYINPILACVIALFAWRALGNKIQFYITTSEPGEKEINNALFAGRDFMKNYFDVVVNNVKVSSFRKIYNSGIFQILSGYFFVIFVINFLAWSLLWLGILPRDYYQLLRLFL